MTELFAARRVASRRGYRAVMLRAVGIGVILTLGTQFTYN
jgi:hypothetical protein